MVVSLKKKPSRNTYLPEVSYQFPKLDRPTKQMREAEERLKAIPSFASLMPRTGFLCQSIAVRLLSC